MTFLLNLAGSTRIFFPLPAVETNTGHSGNEAEAVEALRQHWSSLQSDVHWTSHEDILECAGEITSLLRPVFPDSPLLMQLQGPDHL